MKSCVSLNKTLILTRKCKYMKLSIFKYVPFDYQGWNDVGWNNADMWTPNLDRMAYGGVILNQSYANPICTP